MRVLIVKLTSMGDVIQLLPALTDAANAIPGIEFDWVVDEAFAEIPLLHPNVKRIIKSAHRRWRKTKWQSLKSGEIAHFVRELRSQQYDLVIDAQNNLKSALVTRLSRGLRCGMDKASVRERGAHLAYQKTVSIPGIKNQHAIARVRSLFAAVLGYPLPNTPPNHTIDLNKIPTLTIDLPKPYLVFTHSTTWPNKHWPENYWHELTSIANQAGYHVVLPWGGAHELERAKRLAEKAVNATVLPRLRISEQARVMLGAEGVFTLDTGLGHLAAGINATAIHLYGPTDPNLLGVFSLSQKYLAAEYPCAPCYLRECKFGPEAECMVKKLTPAIVWQNFIDQA